LDKANPGHGHKLSITELEELEAMGIKKLSDRGSSGDEGAPDASNDGRSASSPAPTGDDGLFSPTGEGSNDIKHRDLCIE
jgi:hypothetical protein